MQRMETTRHDLYYFHADLIVLQIIVSARVYSRVSLSSLGVYLFAILRSYRSSPPWPISWSALFKRFVSIFLSNAQTIDNTHQMTQLQQTTNKRKRMEEEGMREGALPILNTEEWHAGRFRKLDSLRATGNAFAHETSTTPSGPQQGNRQTGRETDSRNWPRIGNVR